MKAVIPAAGLGTRLLPATKSMPKEMLPVVDKPVIQYVVEEAVAAGCDDILIITGRGKRAIEDHFDRNFELEHHLRARGREEALKRLNEVPGLGKVHYVRQAEPLGLGDAILCARRFVGVEPFAVLLGDDIMLHTMPPVRRLVEVHGRTGCSALSVMRVPSDHVSRYGILETGAPDDEGVMPVRRVVEKPRPEAAPSNLAAVGRYVLTPDVFDLLTKTGPGFGGEIQLADALDLMARARRLHAVPFEGVRLDVGSVAGLIEANIRAALARPDLADDVRALLRSLSG